MSILDSFFTNPPKLDTFFSRKLQIPHNSSFILTGPRASGKSALVIDYINSINKPYLYIDCQDPIFILEDIDKFEIEEFIQEENIKVLVLDHYFEGFLDSFPEVEQLIIISRDNINLNLPSLTLYPLDFEEFINFKATNSATAAFNLYTKFGSLPKVAKSSNAYLSSRELFFEKFDSQEGKVLLILALYQGKVATSHQIYTTAKDYFKISKDWLYKTIKNFEKEGLLFQINTLQKGFGKKIILYDFLFSKYLNKRQQFITSFDSIVALALLKHKIDIKASTLPLGYLTNSEFIQISPFEDEAKTWQKAQSNFGFYTQNGIKNVTILTINSYYSFKIKNTTFNALPFYEWVVGL